MVLAWSMDVRPREPSAIHPVRDLAYALLKGRPKHNLVRAGSFVLDDM